MTVHRPGAAVVPSPTARHLLRRLPDQPRWVETRWLLASGEGRLHADAHGGVVVGRRLPLGAVVGRPAPDLLREVADGLELVVQAEDLPHAHAALGGWTSTWARLHRWPDERRPPAAPTTPRVVVSDPPAPALLGALAVDARRWAQPARALAVALVDGRPVALCIALAVTGTLWDVGVETDPDHRRRGHARDCFAALARHLDADGLRPVWSATQDNAASLAMAASLGFTAVGRVALLHPPGARSTPV